MTHGRLIAQGRTAEIFEWDEGSVLKLFRAGWSREAAEDEARTGRIVAAVRLAPAVGDIVEVDGRAGIVYERVEGPSLLHVMLRQPWRVQRHARLLAELHAKMHAIVVPDLPSQRARLEERLRAVRAAHPRIGEAALHALARLPADDKLCHGDFHPANVICAPRGPVIIDWNDATRGQPLADVARTSLLARVGGVPLGMHALARGALFAVRALFHQAYLSRYIQLRTVTRAQIDAWLLPVAVARLTEDIAEERARLLTLIESLM